MKKNEGKTKYYSKRQLSELYELWPVSYTHLPSEFISGVLIGAWPQVFKTILAGREDEDTPF